MSRVIGLPKVDAKERVPKYLQAREILIDAIRAGRFAPGAKLPSTEDISTLVDVSLITAHKALEGLVEQGWLRREVGRGTFVREDVDLNGDAQHREFHIGLLFHHAEHVNIDDYYHGTLINALRRAARRDSARRVEFFFHDGFDLRHKAKQDLSAICIHPPIEAQPEVERLGRRHPVIVLGGAFPQTNLTCVDCDNEGGARAAVRHLHDLGHRRFMILSGPMNLTNARDRARGALAELAARGVALGPRDQPTSQDSVLLDDATRAQIEGRMAEADRPTAIVGGGFYLTLAAIQAVRHVGLRIPQDVSFVGFDDPPSAPLLDPPITTVRQPLVEMAEAAYEQLCKLQRRDRRSRWLSTELVVRNSTAPVAAHAATHTV